MECVCVTCVTFGQGDPCMSVSILQSLKKWAKSNYYIITKNSSYNASDIFRLTYRFEITEVGQIYAYYQLIGKRFELKEEVGKITENDSFIEMFRKIDIKYLTAIHYGLENIPQYQLDSINTRDTSVQICLKALANNNNDQVQKVYITIQNNQEAEILSEKLSKKDSFKLAYAMAYHNERSK